MSELVSAVKRAIKASKRASGASKRANGRASGPVLQSVFLAVLDHSAMAKKRGTDYYYYFLRRSFYGPSWLKKPLRWDSSQSPAKKKNGKQIYRCAFYGGNARVYHSANRKNFCPPLRLPSPSCEVRMYFGYFRFLDRGEIFSIFLSTFLFPY